MKIIIPLILSAAIIFSVFYFNHANKRHVTVEFLKLRPVKEKINVFYNGYKIGSSTKIAPCISSKGVCVNVSLNKNAMFLPENIETKMKQKKIHDRKYIDYIEIIYPDNPSHLDIKENAVIKGELAAGFHNYLNEEVSYGEMEKIKLALLNTTQNLEKATSILGDILESLDKMAKNSEKNVVGAVLGIKKTMSEISVITEKINSSIDPGTIKGILNNTESTLYNLNGTTENIKGLTGEVNGSASDLTGTLNSVNSIAKNTDEIVQGVNCTLRKPFGGIRLIFGKVIK